MAAMTLPDTDGAAAMIKLRRQQKRAYNDLEPRTSVPDFESLGSPGQILQGAWVDSIEGDHADDAGRDDPKAAVNGERKRRSRHQCDGLNAVEAGTRHTHRPTRDSDYMNISEEEKEMKIRISEIDAKQLEAAQVEWELGAAVLPKQLSDKELTARRAERFPRSGLPAPSTPTPETQPDLASDRTGAVLKPSLTRIASERAQREMEFVVTKSHKSSRRSSISNRRPSCRRPSCQQDTPPRACKLPSSARLVIDGIDININDSDPIWPRLRTLVRSSKPSCKLSTGSGLVDAKSNETITEEAKGTQTKVSFLARVCECFRSKQQ